MGFLRIMKNVNAGEREWWLRNGGGGGGGRLYKVS